MVFMRLWDKALDSISILQIYLYTWRITTFPKFLMFRVHFQLEDFPC